MLGSQLYPKPLNLLYPSAGNFIAFVGNFASRAQVHEAIAPVCQVDTRHSEAEQRYVGLGVRNGGRRLFVSFTVRRNRVRIISARPMSRRERTIHEEARKTNGR
jgi:uncharacterized DUF497 family protein